MTDIQEIFKKASVAVITGGASGIGFAAAKHFVGLGMSVAIADLGGERLVSARDELIALAGSDEHVMAIETDVSRRSSLKPWNVVLQRFGRVHVLMNNAGIGPETSIFSPQAGWDDILGVNLLGRHQRHPDVRPRHAGRMASRASSSTPAQSRASPPRRATRPIMYQGRCEGLHRGAAA